MAYKKSIIDQNLEGVAEKLSLPHPLEFQNWNGCSGLNFWAISSKFVTIHTFINLQIIVKPYFANFAGVEFREMMIQSSVQV